MIHRYADERRAVAPRPGLVNRRLIAGHQPLVRVHPLGEDDADLTGVLEQAGNVALGGIAQEVLVVAVIKGVVATAEQRLVGMHAAAVLTEDRLGHEGGIDAVLGRDFLDNQTIGHSVVGDLESVVIADIDLVLAGADLVVAVLDIDTHLIERQHGIAPEVAGDVKRRQIKIAALVENLGALGILEIKELEFRAHIKVVEAHIRGALEGAFELVARVTVIRGAIRVENVADHAANLVLLAAPRQQLESRGVRHGDHVTLFNVLVPGD